MQIIVFDGIDTTFKETNANMLYNEFTKQGKNVKLVSFPRHGNPAAYCIDKFLQGKYKSKLRGGVVASMYLLDMLDYFQSEEEEPDILICDRYIFSTLAYQTNYDTAGDFEPYVNTSISKFYKYKLPLSNIHLFFMTVNKEELTKRLQLKHMTESPDFYEKNADELLKTQKRYVKILKYLSSINILNKFVYDTIDTVGKDEEDIFDEILNALG